MWCFYICFTFDSLCRVINLKNTSDTEMMWVYFLETGIFRIQELIDVPKQFYRNDIRMTLDYKEDLDFFNLVITKLDKKDFDLFDIIKVLDNNPNIKYVNLFRQEEWKKIK